MKKFLALLMAVAMVFALAACGKTATEPAAPAETPAASETPAAPAQQYIINVAHTVAEETSMQKGALAFKEYCEANSNGQLVVNVYPNGQLGSDRETCEGVGNGQVTMMLSSNAVHSNFIDDSIIFDMPFMYTDTTMARKVLDNADFKAKMTEVYAACGYHYIGAADQGFRTLSSNRKVESPADLKGLLIRTMENKYHMQAWKDLGASPTPMNFNEVYSALQNGTIDAQENPIELIYANKFYEVQKYVIMTNHIYQNIVWIMNEDFYQSLPDDLKKVVDEAAEIGIKTSREATDAGLAGNIQAIKDAGVEVIELSADQLQQFNALTDNVRNMIAQDVDPAVYEVYMKAVEAAK